MNINPTSMKNPTDIFISPSRLFMEDERETLSMTFLTPKDPLQSPNVLVSQPKKETTTQTPKTTRGRQKIEIKEIKEDERETLSMTCLTPKDPLQSPTVLVSQPKKETTTQTPKTTRGRQKIEIKEIKEESKRQVTFSKRRRGLFKKSAELSVLTGAKIAVITFSRCGRIYRFGHVDALIDKYLRKSPVKLEGCSGDDVAEEEGRRPWWERPVESVPEEELEDYVAALSVLRENLGKKITAMSNDRAVGIIPAWPINMMGWKPTMDMQSLEDLTDGITRCPVGQNG